LGIPADGMSLMGQSILSPNKRLAFNLVGGAQYVLVENDGYSVLKEDEHVAYQYNWKTGEITRKGKSEDLTLSAYLQYFFTSLISNSFELK
ncbi:MAG TPA: hypothetical protein VKY27_11190, partial [Bacteriovoracaceae bacterium]|nr:hypothetical protein [Bacteriovoracaceae bacterium]